MIRSTLVTRLFFLLSALGNGLITSGPVTAVAPPPPVTLVSASHGLVEWIPLVDSESITLALADSQGLVRTIQFAPGETPVLSLFDTQGVPLADGTHTWEIRVTPRLGADLKRKIEEARRRGDEAQITRLNRLAAPLVQSGYFTVANGSLVAPSSAEQPEKRRRQNSSPAPEVLTAPDQVVPDDLIVDGKGCIGLGCENNEAFGDEALRLRQSVVRLRFLDTSTEAGFPARDWQLTINDSASGGADRFSLEDLTAATTPLTVRGGAPNNSLYVDGVGNIGLGTATPAQDLHIASGSTPTLRLEQTGATARTWDVGANETNFFVRDVTGGTSRIDIATNGNVGFGTSFPEAKIEARGDSVTEIATTTSSDVVSSLFVSRRSRGTSAAPIAIQSGDGLGGFVWRGYDGSVFTDNKAAIIAAAEQNWTSNGHGTRIYFTTTPIGGIIPVPRLMIKGNGRVGIGTLNPVDRFEVSGGNIRVSGGSFIDDGTTLNVPDYVFEPEYKLMPLGELREFVSRERHLPNVPSAADIKKQGLNLSQLQMRMLEKIEEMTLYTLAQHEQIKTQQARIAELQSKNTELDARLAALERAAEQQPQR